MDDSLPQFLGTRLTAASAYRECACDAVVLDNAWMLNGEIGRPRIEVFHGIATSSHHLVHEPIGRSDSAIGIVDEHRLNALPLADERLGLFVRESTDFQLAHTFRALSQQCFGFSG